MTEINTQELLQQFTDIKKQVDDMQKRINGARASSDAGIADPDIDEMRELLAILIEKQNKLESTFGVEKVNLKDGGDRILVTIETSFGTISAHAEKGTHSPVTYSGSTVVGTGGPAPGVGGGKGGGPHGMTPEQLQEFKKQSLQIGAAQQKLRELETRLNDASTSIKKFGEKSEDMEQKEAENVKELYACIDSINTSLSEKIALQKVEVQKIAGDQPKPINYDPFNYGEAYGGDLVDFQARKRITELKLLMQGLQAALLQMRDSMKVSPSIDLGYKVVRLDQLVGSTGFGQKVNNGEVASDEVLLVEQSTERLPGKVEYPRKVMNQTSAEMESKWAITDSIMQTMYRLEMELGDIQKIVDKTGLSSGSKVIEEVQQSIKHIKDRQIDVKTVKRLIEDSKDSSVNLMAGRKSAATSGQRNTLPQIHGESSESNVAATRKMEQNIRQMQSAISNINKKMSGAASTKTSDTSLRNAAATKVPKTGEDNREMSCLSCHRNVRGPACGEIKAYGTSHVSHSYFSPSGIKPRIRGPASNQVVLNRTYNINLGRDKPEVYSIPRPCGAGYTEHWPLPKSFDSTRFKNLFQPPPVINDTKYIKGSDGRYYRSTNHHNNVDHQRREVPMSITQAVRPRPSFSDRPSDKVPPGPGVEEDEEIKQAQQEFAFDQVSNSETVEVVVLAASDEALALLTEQRELEEQMERDRIIEEQRRESLEHKKYKFKIKSDYGGENQSETNPEELEKRRERAAQENGSSGQDDSSNGEENNGSGQSNHTSEEERNESGQETNASEQESN